jgi:hypothetical protein
MCYQKGAFIDLASQCLYIYMQVVGYYRNFNSLSAVHLQKARVLLALCLHKMSNDKQEVTNIVNQECTEL